MKKSRVWLLGLVLCGGLGGWIGLRVLTAGPSEFDRLSSADRQMFAKRFDKEIWPLMARNGKDGCVGCHSGKIVSALKLTGDAKKDFAMLLREGFFLYADDGSVLARVSARDKERRMPRGKAPWAEKDIHVLRAFMADMDKKQKK